MNVLPAYSVEISKAMECFTPSRTLAEFNNPTVLSSSSNQEPEIMMNIANYFLEEDEMIEGAA